MRMFEADNWYDTNRRIIFTNSRGLTGVGLPRKASKSYPDGPYWEDLAHMTTPAHQGQTVTQQVLDDTLPGGPHEKTITYTAPWTRTDRESDYATAWSFFLGAGGRTT